MGSEDYDANIEVCEARCMGEPVRGFGAVESQRFKRCFQEGASVLLLQYQGVHLRLSKMPYEINEQKKIGIGLIGFGILFSFFGVILFFDRGLLALGNIFFLSGVALLLGWRSTWRLFTNRANYKGSVSFLLGLFLIFVRWPMVGIVLQTFGSISLFSGFWPSTKIFLYQVPVLGWILKYPSLLLDRLRSS